MWYNEGTAMGLGQDCLLNGGYFMNRIELYKEAKSDLEEYAHSCNIKNIEKYYLPQKYDETVHKSFTRALNYYFYLFCGHLADRQFMGNVIKFYFDGSDTQQILQEVLFFYDPQRVIEKYNDIDDLKQAIRVINPIKIQNEAKWDEYLTGIYQCAVFLISGEIGNNALSFDDLLSEPMNSDSMKIYLHSLRPIINNITGVGTAVCYNWLKECGATWLAKPDLHIKRIVGELIKQDSPSNYKEIINAGYETTICAEKVISKYLKLNPQNKCFPKDNCYGIRTHEKLTLDEFIALYMWEWANDIRIKNVDSNITTYKLDRILYLYCTNGDFYMDRDKKISERKLFEKIKENK